jgi:hypothetical protein
LYQGHVIGKILDMIRDCIVSFEPINSQSISIIIMKDELSICMTNLPFNTSFIHYYYSLLTRVCTEIFFFFLGGGFKSLESIS